MEFSPCQGGKLARAAGTFVSLQGLEVKKKEGAVSTGFVVKIPSGTLKTLSPECFGLLESSSNENHK